MMQTVVGRLLVANVVLFLAEQAMGDDLIRLFGLWPLGLLSDGGGLAPPFRPWQVVSYGFLHGSILHLVLNMYALWMFGRNLEAVWGARRFTVYYFSCLIGAALTQLVVSEFVLMQGGEAYPVIGASGAVFGLLLAYGVLFPYDRIILLFPPMAIQVAWFVIGYGAIELIAGVTGSAEGVAHFAHLGGMLTGALLIWGRHRA
ncbi:rhomboid family intramembrane serine protease [Parasulfuritortus cantonensis]|uniref:Rhomboid family intramembrane serine protease n=1 Tax=Parasulfuritortus cantonensis TaxID=2528202 RepID=A0A4R1B5K7_9PROT|nr:rhomboid family intramembrane serine protease [Parasulfuritortus cantonensis]TCJ13422.1 rhomboid family intramembrane serine protease [Parasulfuritortus cantonensis]